MILRVTYHLLVGDDVTTEYDHRELRYVEHLLYPPENATVRILREVGWRGEVRVNGEPVDLG